MNEETIFAAALKKSSAERAVYLDEVCQGDQRLKSDVQQLLEAHDKADMFLEASVANVPLTLDHDSGNGSADCDGTISEGDTDGIAEGPGTVVDRYKLLQRIGEGGMGVVYMAEQTVPVHRRVALKIIKPGMDTKQVIARFEAERQALAMMDHHNIARVLDAGTTASGRPYFVMELVRGIPITEYCDKHKLSTNERLKLFTQVCDAVQHAHQKGIIHRDIKPSNVMVTSLDGQAVPKVIDFGIAKATNQRLTEITMFTDFGQIIGTLEYMSPEQAELGGLDVDTRTDVYALGVLLYELLTSSTPIRRERLRNIALDKALRTIRDEEPVKPSSRLSDSGKELTEISAHRQVEPKRLCLLVRGDLDWIVMKALDKDRTRRYETANGFAADVHRYLENEPVLATPPSTLYRLRKFARKHRAAVLTSATLAIVLLVALTVSAFLAAWALKSQTVAAEERQARQDIEQLMEDLVRQQEIAKKNEAEAIKQKAIAVNSFKKADVARIAEAKQRELAEIAKAEAIEHKRIAEANLTKAIEQEAFAKKNEAEAVKQKGIAETNLAKAKEQEAKAKLAAEQEQRAKLIAIEAGQRARIEQKKAVESAEQEKKAKIAALVAEKKAVESAVQERKAKILAIAAETKAKEEETKARVAEAESLKQRRLAEVNALEAIKQRQTAEAVRKLAEEQQLRAVVALKAEQKAKEAALLEVARLKSELEKLKKSLPQRDPPEDEQPR